jgi:Na+-translocating ferredoxin:NAD+ oxidoreductase subunit G
MKNIIAMLATLSVIGVISGGGLAMVSGWADPLIAANKKADTERAIFLVQPEGKSYEVVGEAPFELYRVLDDSSATIGYALPWEGNGFQGKIRIMIGVGSDLRIISSIEVLEQVETPGLGTEILKDPFRNQFTGLLAEPQVDWVKGVPPTKENEIQTITGATITAKAVVAIINDGLARLRKQMQQGGAK